MDTTFKLTTKITATEFSLHLLYPFQTFNMNDKMLPTLTFLENKLARNIKLLHEKKLTVYIPSKYIQCS